ncbi:MerR family transcriptional regulator [Streptomyces sp. TLI_171]|uniref:MerR family transcriptional regulator n=1 Tax=Streptomyces sp. TLI_171 TaxID=1938859 RepID=UPI000C182E5A|nr:MerR family transcriptional regulator [Streptomyces sp. TLI_171]RKE21607.1 protein phosphatase [Streptomyces sp. TLI_171]
MELLTIGAFARAARLSPKALRLYDELGLLRPAEVDPVTGYRRYSPGQLERARLVLWLRRLGMPLARIRRVLELPPATAAREVAAYWELVRAETEARRELAALLVDHLSGKDGTMNDTTAHGLRIRYAAGTDTGLVRARNEDAAYAGPGLIAVADGTGPQGGGELASAAAIEALKEVELPAGELLNVLEAAIAGVDAKVGGASELPGAGTTLTAMLWSGTQLALVHIGDSRAYLLRGGELFRITHDHTLVQSMVDDGRLTLDEAASHPQRTLLVRALTGSGENRPDVSLHPARPGDRYLLCSDGLSRWVTTEALHTVLTMVAAPEQAVRQLMELALRAGGPDNIACAVADVLEPDGD